MAKSRKKKQSKKLLKKVVSKSRPKKKQNTKPKSKTKRVTKRNFKFKSRVEDEIVTSNKLELRRLRIGFRYKRSRKYSKKIENELKQISSKLWDRMKNKSFDHKYTYRIMFVLKRGRQKTYSRYGIGLFQAKTKSMYMKRVEQTWNNFKDSLVIYLRSHDDVLLSGVVLGSFSKI